MTSPAELQRSTPRPVSLTSQGWKSMLRRCVYPTCLIGAGVIRGFLPISGASSLSASAASSAVAYGMPLWLAWGWRACLWLLLAAIIGLVRFRRQSHLLRYGRPAVAIVKGVNTPWWYNFRGGNRRTRWRRIQCEVRLLNGRVSTLNLDIRNEIPEEGTEVIVVYDRDQPERAILYPQQVVQIDLER